jgi:hypothetical protein
MPTLAFGGQPLPGPDLNRPVPPRITEPPPLVDLEPAQPPLQIADLLDQVAPPVGVMGGPQAWSGSDFMTVEGGGGVGKAAKQAAKFVAKAVFAPITPTGIAKTIIQTAATEAGIAAVNALIGAQPPSPGVHHNPAATTSPYLQKGDHWIA